jgi:hypothetical protein
LGAKSQVQGYVGCKETELTRAISALAWGYEKYRPQGYNHLGPASLPALWRLDALDWK